MVEREALLQVESKSSMGKSYDHHRRKVAQINLPLNCLPLRLVQRVYSAMLPLRYNLPKLIIGH